ncbi:MAG: hypothetical protein QMD53_03325 [Actinomycetota bacterium]|nr:hypothetical protein [Actinomycetota bacterium]
MQPVTSLPLIGHISSVSSSGQLRLGEIVLARVMATFGQSVVIRLAGENIMAETGLSLTPGQFIKLRVDEVKKDKVLLKLVEKGEAERGDSLKGKELFKVESILSLPKGEGQSFGVEIEKVEAKGKEGDDEEAAFGLVIALDMENLGSVKIFFESSKAATTCVIEVDAKGAKDYLFPLLSRLKESLARILSREVILALSLGKKRERG